MTDTAASSTLIHAARAGYVAQRLLEHEHGAAQHARHHYFQRACSAPPPEGLDRGGQLPQAFRPRLWPRHGAHQRAADRHRWRADHVVAVAAEGGRGAGPAACGRPPLAMVTNTTSSTRASIAGALAGAGFAVTADDILTAPVMLWHACFGMVCLEAQLAGSSRGVDDKKVTVGRRDAYRASVASKEYHEGSRHG
jgi:hypothetical protein